MERSGIPLHMKGYECVKSCIDVLLKNPDKNMKQVYYEVSEEMKCKAGNVERNIRSVIKESYKSMDSNIKKTCFHGKKKLPTTAEYIKSIVCAIRNNLI